MWQVVFVANDKTEAENLKNKLLAEGFLVKVDFSDNSYQLKAPASEAEEVCDYLSNSY